MMGMVPSYRDHEWQVVEHRRTAADLGSAGVATLQIRVLEGEKFMDYWIPQDDGNADYQKYLEWKAEGNEPRLVF